MLAEALTLLDRMLAADVMPEEAEFRLLVTACGVHGSIPGMRIPLQLVSVDLHW